MPTATDERPERGVAEFNCITHPLVQAWTWGFPRLYPWQEKIINELCQVRARVIGSTNNESGKSSLLIPLFGLSVMCAFPGATVFSTAGAESQIRGQLFNYLSAKIKPYEPNGWRISMSDLVLHAPPQSGLPPSRWEARVPKDALTMEGYHGRWERDNKKRWRWLPVCVIIDEAKSIDPVIIQEMFRIDPDWAFVVSTPGEIGDAFYRTMEPERIEMP